MNYFFLMITFCYCIAVNAQVNYDGYQPQKPIDPIEIALHLLQQNIDDAVDRIEHNEVTIVELKKVLEELKTVVEHLKKEVVHQDYSFDYRVKYLIASYLHDHAQTADNSAGTLTMSPSFFEYLFSFFKPGKHYQSTYQEEL